jgi:hypothetical protein
MKQEFFKSKRIYLARLNEDCLYSPDAGPKPLMNVLAVRTLLKNHDE